MRVLLSTVSGGAQCSAFCISAVSLSLSDLPTSSLPIMPLTSKEEEEEIASREGSLAEDGQWPMDSAMAPHVCLSDCLSVFFQRMCPPNISI